MQELILTAAIDIASAVILPDEACLNAQGILAGRRRSVKVDVDPLVLAQRAVRIERNEHGVEADVLVAGRVIGIIGGGHRGIGDLRHRTVDLAVLPRLDAHLGADRIFIAVKLRHAGLDVITAAARDDHDGASLLLGCVGVIHAEHRAVQLGRYDAVRRLLLHALQLDLVHAELQVKVADFLLLLGAHLCDLRRSVFAVIVDDRDIRAGRDIRRSCPQGLVLLLHVVLLGNEHRETDGLRFLVARKLQWKLAEQLGVQGIALAHLEHDPQLRFFAEELFKIGLIVLHIRRAEVEQRRGLRALAAHEIGQLLRGNGNGRLRRLRRLGRLVRRLRLRRLRGGIRRLRRHIGAQAVDVGKVFFGLVEVQVVLLDCDLLPLDLNVGERGVITEQRIALLDGLTLLHEQGCDGLRIGGIDLLQVIRCHVAGLRTLVREPAHKHGHGRDLDRVAAMPKVPQHAHDDRRGKQQADARNYDRFDTLFLMQGSHRPFCRLTGCRRGYN